MSKFGFMLFLICSVSFLSGCASIVTGKYQEVIVTSTPPGALVKTSSNQIGWTPCSLEFVRDENVKMTAEYDGLEQQRVLQHGLQGWFWGNILVGGIIGGAVDLSTGACDKLSEDHVHFDFTPMIAERQKRRSDYIKSHLGINEKIMCCIESGQVIEGMSREQIIASLGPPAYINENENGVFMVYSKYGKQTKIFPLKNDVYCRPKLEIKER